MKRSGPLRRGKALKQKGAMKRGKLRQRSVKREAAMAIKVDGLRLAQLGWRAECVAGGVCACCGAAPAKGEWLQAHHVLPKEYIKKYVSGLQLPAQAAAELLHELLWDKRNSMPLKNTHHALHTNRKRPVPWTCIEPRHLQFAGALGMVHVLTRQYPRSREA